MAIKTLEDLFVHTLKDILYAERTILKSLPKMEKKAASDTLKSLFSEHREETEGQVERVEQVLEQLGASTRAEKCDAILGIVDEAEELMEEIDDAETCDAGLVAAAQAVEHYEIARYGTLIAWAEELGHHDAAELLKQNLGEEEAADKKLTSLAESRVNRKAA